MGKTLGYGEITVANMTEPFTVMLTNEAQQFATDSNRKVTSAQSYYTDIIVIRGSQERTDYTIGNITSGSGITVSKSSKRVTFNVSAGSVIGADTGVIEIPITLDGQTVKKQFSWSCGKQGPQGAAGQDGSNFAWNLIKCGKGDVKKGFFKNFNKVENGYGELTLTSKKSYQGLYISDGFVVPVRNYPVGSKLIWSYDIMYTKWDFPAGTNHQEFWLGQRYTNAPSGETATGQWTSVTLHQLPVVGRNGCELNKWLHVEAKVVVPKKASDNVGTENKFQFYNSGNDTATVTLRMKNVKLEYGDTATPWSPAQSDLEGRGVSETVQYYLATSQATGVTSFTSGWSTDITTQKITATKKYLWNCSQTRYTDGTSEPISTPKVIGVYGDKGNGIVASVQRPNKTEFWWSQVGAVGHKDTFDDSSNTRNNCRVGDIFTVMGTSTEGNSHTVYYKSATDSGDLAGECINHVIAESGTDAKNLSITPSSQYFKSTDGGKTFAPNTITIKPTIQGEINFGKWQYSIDGGVSFADVVSGQKGLTISNNVLTVSKDSGLYSDAVTMVTFRAVASDSSFYDTCSIAKIYDVSDIGDGRNLWITRDNITLQACEKDKYIYTTTGTSAVCIGADVSSVGTNTIALQTGTKYTISFVISSPSEVSNARWFFCTALNNTGVKNYGGYGVKLVTGENIVSQTITVDTSCDAAGLVIYNLPTDCIIKDIQVEKGSSPTGWTPAPEDIQTAILSTKSEISDVSLKVDNNKQAIEQRVEKTTYQQDLTLVKGNISKANEGLNKWRYEIYPKSLFASEYQGKSTMDVFAKNTNLTPSQSVLINDTDLSIAWNYDNNYIGYALTFVKFSAAKSVAITFAHDDGAHIYLNGKLIGGNDGYNNKGESLTLGFVKGWNCIEVVVNEGASTEGFKLGTTLSAISECQLMNCYYGTPVARQSHITNQLVENTTNIKGINTKVSKVTSVIGENGENFTSFKNDYSDFKQTMNGFKTTVGQTYVTKDDFNGLEIGGVNLFVKSTASRGWWISDTGVLNANGGWGYSDYIDVSGMKNYIASGFTNLGISPATCFYDSNKTFISGVESKNQNSQDSKRKTLPIPSNAKYMRFSFALADINTLKIEQGTKATVYSPSPYDDEINGQNLVSNLPANWEQGTVTEGSAVGTTYANTKSASAGSVRPKELIPVSGNITISTAYSNQSKKPIRHWIAAYDVNKNYLGNNYVSNAWNSFPRTLDMKDAKYIAIMVGYADSSAITPSDISKICLKIERGTSATPFTLAPEDVNGKIQSVETIATQTATEIGWLINRNGSTASSLKLTENALTAIAENINLTGRVKFSSLSTDAKQGILNSFEVGGRNLALNTSNSYSTAFTSFSGVENTCFGLGQVTCKGIAIGDVVTVHLYIKYTDIVPASGQTARIWTQGSGNITVWNDGGFGGSEHKTISGSGEFEFLYSFTMSSAMYINTYWDCALRTDYIASGSIQYKAFKVEKGNKATDWTPAPEDYLPQANLVSNWTTNSTWIDGGKIYTGSITADKIAANAITANKIATDAIKSRNYISSGGTQGSFLNLSDGSFKSPNLSWDSNGNLIASNANLSGLINATKGTVGGWNIATNGLYSGIDENAIKIYSATTYDAQTMYQKQKIQDSFILSQKYINHFVSQQVSVGHNIPYWQTRSFIYNDSQIQLAQSDYCINTSSASNYDAQYSLKDGYISATRIYMEQNITQVGGDVINSSFSIGLDSMMGWCSIQSTKGINIYGNSSRALYVQSNDTSKYNALETEGDVVVNGKIHAVSGDNKIQLNSDNNGSIELYGNTPFIDFHSAYSSADYTCRIIANTPEQLLVCGKLRCDSNIISNNDLIANSWVYAGQNAHYTWQNQLDCYFSCGSYNNTNNVYYYAGYHAFYVNNDSGSGMMYINTNGVTSRVGFTKTSDERIKKNFESFDDNIIDAYMNIEPVKYQLKQSSNDNYHFGFKAQHVDKVFSDYGDTYNESFDICTSRPIDPDKAKELYGVDDMTEEYGLRYDELIAPTTYMVQHTYKELQSTKDELTKVKQEKADLETRLQAIEAKLGL